MNVALWLAQSLLAAVFVPIGAATAAGIMERRAKEHGIEIPIEGTALRLIGVAELAGGVGVLVPVVTGILPVLTPLAAAGLALVMLGAIVVNVRMGKPSAALVNVVLTALCVVVVVGRWPHP